MAGAGITNAGLGKAALSPGAERCFSVGSNTAHIALLNLTPVNASAPGYGYVSYKVRGAVIPSDASNVNFSPGTVDPNLAVVPIFNPHPQYVDVPGAACFVNSNHGNVDLVVDSLGSIANAAFILPESGGPTRVLDTRIGDGGTRLARRARVCFHVNGSPGDIALINLTPVLAAGAGFGLLLSSDAAVVPVASNVNFASGTIDPNVAVAPIGADGRVCFVNSNHTSVDLVADQLGSIRHDSFVLPSASAAPVRVLDTRLPGGHRLAAGVRACFAVAGTPGDAALVNLTPILASGPGYGVLVSSGAATAPLASNVNFAPGTIDPNVAIAPIGADGRVCFVNSNHATVDLVADHLGTIASAAYVPPTPTGVPLRLLDTRPIGEVTLTAGALNIQALDCAPGRLCVAAGQSSAGRVTVVRSLDSGRTWSAPQVLGTIGSVTHIDCPSPSTCFLVGGAGGSAFMLKSEDAGATFDVVSTPVAGATFRDIDCPSNEVCTALTDLSPSTLLRTFDGGHAWTQLLPDVAQVSEIECPAADDCFIAGRVPDTITEGLVARSSDGGSTWQTVTEPNFATRYDGLHCFDGTRCVVVETFSFFHIFGQMRRTVLGTDGGDRAAPAFGGTIACANPGWCVETASETSASTWSAGSTGWIEYGIAAPGEPSTTHGLQLLSCPLADTCFFRGSSGVGEFLTRVMVA